MRTELERFNMRELSPPKMWCYELSDARGCEPRCCSDAYFRPDDSPENIRLCGPKPNGRGCRALPEVHHCPKAAPLKLKGRPAEG